SLEVLDDLVRTMFATARWNANPAFVALKAQILKIPALPTLYTDITNALQKPDTSLEEIAALIAREATVSAKLLQVVNSPVFALRQRVSSIRDASNFLGIQRLRALVLSTSLIGQCDASRCQSFVPAAFESHSLQIANWASRIAVGETRNRQLAELAFTGGLLHQFGVLLLAANLPESYDQVLRNAAAQNISVARVERENYGVTHAELAAFILASWHIPFPIVNAVGFHPLPSLCDETSFSPLSAVHLATAIDIQAATGLPDFDRDYLERLNIQPRLEYWAGKLAEDE
ncbi:MAG: HDOD domain-containing protein, partial [Chthoniobacteraceae bacterium]